MDNDTKYASYNVLSRKALIYGVPIKLLIFILCAALASGFGGVMAWGLFGIAPPIVLMFILMIVRIKCQDDSRAIDRISWDLKAWFSRLRCQSSITSFTSIDTSNKKRRQNVREFIKNNCAK